MRQVVKTILPYTPFPFLAKRSRKWYLPGFQGLALYDVLQFLRMRLRSQSLTERASAISFNFVMSIPPSLLFLFTLLPNLPFVPKKSIKAQLHFLINDIIPSKIYNKQVIDFVDGFIDSTRIGLLSFGLLLSLFFASGGMMGIMRSFNKKNPGFEQRKRLHMRLTALKLTFIVFGLLFACLLLLILQGALLRTIVVDKDWREVIRYTRWAFIVAIVLGTIGFIFKYAPAVQKRWSFFSPGTVLTTTLCILASVGFSVYVNNFGKYNALYGSIGTIMMVMALIFVNSLALLIGFELNVSIHALRSKLQSHEHQEATAEV